MSRIPRLSVGFVRSKSRLGLVAGSVAMRSLAATVAAIAEAKALPSTADFETKFSPGRAYVHRIQGQNLWVSYRFDETHVDFLAVRRDPPMPLDPDDGKEA